MKYARFGHARPRLPSTFPPPNHLDCRGCVVEQQMCRGSELEQSAADTGAQRNGHGLEGGGGGVMRAQARSAADIA